MSDKITFILTTAGREHFPTATIKSIKESAGDLLGSIVVVDDGWDDVKRAPCEALGAVYLESPIIFGGFGRAVNLGFKEAQAIEKTKYTVILHDDVIIPRNYDYQKLIDTAVDYAKPCLLSVKQLHPRGNLSNTYVVFEECDGQKWIRPEMVNWYKEANAAETQAIVPAVKSGFWFLETELFERLGMFDERFSPILFEDIDFCMAVRAADGAVIYMPYPSVTHVTKATANESFIDLGNIGNTNFQKFVEKWGGHPSELLKFHKFGI